MTSNPFLHLLQLLEAYVGGVLSEALTAQVEVVLPAIENRSQTDTTNITVAVLTGLFS